MIRFGPAGIPLSCKGRTLKDGIIDLHHLGLTAMEVQFIKVNSAQRAALPEEAGKRVRDFPEQLVVEVGQPGRKGFESSPQLLEGPLSRKSRLTALTWFLAKDYPALAQARLLARSVDIRLSLHAPFYVDFLNSPAAKKRSRDHFRWSCALASAIGADVLVGHLGFYGPEGPEASLELVTHELRAIRQWLDGLPGGHRILLGIEPNGHPEVLGSKEEILHLTRKVSRVLPILNIPHLAVREGTYFDNKKAMETLLEEFSAVSHGELYVNFSGVLVHGRGSFRMTPIKRGKVKFETVADILAERGFDATVISSSPLMEHDAMYMRLLYERSLAKQFARKAEETKKPVKAAPPPCKTGAAPAKGKPAPRHPLRRAPPPSRKRGASPKKRKMEKGRPRFRPRPHRKVVRRR